jgi:hypothetical protein
MPKILITGNGFDLHLKLPTSYSDFIKISQRVSEGYMDFEEIYRESIFGEHITTNYKPFSFDPELIERFKEKLKENIWYDFFKNEYNIKTWIDFESKIGQVLKHLAKTIEIIKTEIFSKRSRNKKELSYDGSVFNSNIETIEISKKTGVLFGDYYVVHLNSEYLKIKNHYYYDVDDEKIFNNLLNQLDEFKEIFNLYFKIFVHPLLPNVKKDSIISIFSKFNKHYTFNYSKTYDIIFNKSDFTNHLHGQINRKTSKIVMGIDDLPSSLTNIKEAIPFTKYFQKLHYETDYHFFEEYKSKKNLNYLFCFFGHSLDESDKDYVNETFDFINELKGKKSKIVIIYHDSESKSSLLINLLKIRGKKDIETLMKNNKLLLLDIKSPKLKKELNKDLSSGPRILVI